MSAGKTCGKCQHFLKINWHDKPGSVAVGRNGLCEKYDYNIQSDGTYAKRCRGYKGIRFQRCSAHNKVIQRMQRAHR